MEHWKNLITSRQLERKEWEEDDRLTRRPENHSEWSLHRNSESMQNRNLIIIPHPSHLLIKVHICFHTDYAGRDKVLDHSLQKATEDRKASDLHVSHTHLALIVGWC